MLIKASRIPFRQVLIECLLPSPLKVAAYRAKGARIGRGVSIGLGSVIVADHIEVGHNTVIGFGTILRGREILIGSHVKIGAMTFLDTEKIFIGDDAKINEQVFAGGPTLPESYLHIGARTIVMQYTFLNPTKPLIIEDDAGIGGKCNIFTHGSWQNILDGYPVKFAPVHIGRSVWIPWQVFIMPGVIIGDGATIGAGSIVVKDIPAGALAAGVPAKVLKTMDEYPSKLGFQEQQTVLREILGEFKRYLEYFHFGVTELTSTDHWKVWEIQGHERRGPVVWRFCFTLDTCCEPLPMKTNRAVFLSLTAIDESIRRQVESRGMVWFDLEAKQRSKASNDLGDDVASFIARYGIRCERV